MILFKGRGWLHTGLILEISHPFCFSPSPSPSLLQYKCCCGHLTLQSDLNIAEGKQSAWLPQKVLARTVVYLAPLSARIYAIQIEAV